VPEHYVITRWLCPACRSELTVADIPRRAQRELDRQRDEHVLGHVTPLASSV